MSAIAMGLVLQAALGASDGESYAQAYKDTETTGKPLLVLVGADWCPACRTMKGSTIPQLKRRGALAKVAFAMVDRDHERKLAGRLMRGSAIPQLILYTKTTKGWERQEIVGLTSERQVEALIASSLRRSDLKSDGQVRETASGSGAAAPGDGQAVDGDAPSGKQGVLR